MVRGKGGGREAREGELDGTLRRCARRDAGRNRRGRVGDPTFGGMGQGAKDSSSGVWSFLSGPALVMVMRVALSA